MVPIKLTVFFSTVIVLECMVHLIETIEYVQIQSNGNLQNTQKSPLN